MNAGTRAMALRRAFEDARNRGGTIRGAALDALGQLEADSESRTARAELSAYLARVRGAAERLLLAVERAEPLINCVPDSRTQDPQ